MSAGVQSGAPSSLTLVRPIWCPASSSGLPSRRAGVWSLSVLGDVQDQTGLGTVLSNRFCQPYFEQGNWTKRPEIPTLNILGLFL